MQLPWNARVIALCVLALSASTQVSAAQVRIAQEADGYRLLVDGAPFVIKGAGLGNGSMETLAARGGNALRTWRVDPDPQRQRALLDRAQRNGLKVAVGIEFGNQRHGFDYDDAAAVKQQLQRVLAQVRQSAAHPAVLMWVVGNELNLDYTNPKVWNAVGEIAEAIHAIDPDHPVTTTLAGFDKQLIDQLKTRAPALDLIAVQLYGDIAALPQKLHESGWRGPYVVTEWGPTGHWESPTTRWGAPIEDDSTRKALLLEQRYRSYIASDTRQGLGSFVFLWGDKQERTPTWYGLFLPSGEATPSVDTLQLLWTGQWPASRAPAVSATHAGWPTRHRQRAPSPGPDRDRTHSCQRRIRTALRLACAHRKHRAQHRWRSRDAATAGRCRHCAEPRGRRPQRRTRFGRGGAFDRATAGQLPFVCGSPR